MSVQSSGVVVSSRHAFGREGSPARLHSPVGHSLAVEHGVPSFGPLTQRLPPHCGPNGPGGSGQSLSSSHASSAGLLQVWQKHFLPGAALPQFGLVGPSVRLCVPVENVSGPCSRVEMMEPGTCGQSKLEVPSSS